MAREKNFDQYMAKNPPAAFVKAKAEYEKLAKVVSTTGETDPKYKEIRAQKLAASIVMHKAREDAEQEYFAEEVKEVKEAVKTYKEEQAKKTGAPAMA